MSTQRAPDAQPTPEDATRDILERCTGLGFALAGIATIEPSRHEPHLRQWLAAGKHATMEYLEKDLEMRLDPARLLPGAKCAIMVADLYVKRGDGFAPAGVEAQPGRGRIARYARGRDYHGVMKRRLHRLCDGLRIDYPGSEFRSFVDTAPAPERELAERAGLGWIAKNTMLIHPRLGSYLLLGGALTTMDLRAPREQTRLADHCGTCTRCIDACPTGAIEPWTVNASKCISYLTIERREAVAAELRRPIGDWIFGCDVCQEVCPHNSPREDSGGPVLPAYSPRREGFDVLEILGWNEADRRAAFETSAMKRAPLETMQRNASIVIENQRNRSADAGLL